MISPEILKQSATAGFAGLAVATTVIGVALSSGGPSQAGVDVSQWTDPVRVSFDAADEVTDRAAAAADREQGARPAQRTAIRARNRAARRAREKLQTIDCRPVDSAKLEAEKVRLHINRAARDVIRQP